MNDKLDSCWSEPGLSLFARIQATPRRKRTKKECETQAKVNLMSKNNLLY